MSQLRTLFHLFFLSFRDNTGHLEVNQVIFHQNFNTILPKGCISKSSLSNSVTKQIQHNHTITPPPCTPNFPQFFPCEINKSHNRVADSRSMGSSRQVAQRTKYLLILLRGESGKCYHSNNTFTDLSCLTWPWNWETTEASWLGSFERDFTYKQFQMNRGPFFR